MTRSPYVSVVFLAITAVMSTHARGAGLEELSQQNPEVQAPEAAPSAGAAANEGAAAPDAAAVPAVPSEPSAVSKSLSQKAFLATSFGWLKASRAKGDWEGSGMSDVTLGYRLPNATPTIATAITYRYAPMTVSGTEDRHSYRGTWDAHYAGGRGSYSLNPKVTVHGTLELGYVAVYLDQVDGLTVQEKHEANGTSVVLGTGADWQVGEQNAVYAGPRLFAGFGSFATLQVAAAASFVF